jgi:hypothetical protein
LNVVCGSSVNHPVTPKFWSRTNNIVAIHWYIATLQPIMMNHRNLTFCSTLFCNQHPSYKQFQMAPIHFTPNFHPFSPRRYTVSPGPNGHHV